MFKYKNAMISMAVVAMLAACGGGGGSNGNGGGGGSNPGDTNNPPTGGGNAIVSDADLSGALTLENAGVLIPQGTGFAPQAYSAFNSNAARGPGDPNEGGYGLYGYDGGVGTGAPIEAFAIRVDPIADDIAAAPTADDTKTGSVAFQLQDQASVANGQILRILVSQVSTTVTPAGALSIDVLDGATLTVYAKNEAGTETTVTVPATDALFTVAAATPEAGSPAGDTSYDIVLNVAAAVAAAKAAPGANAAVLDSIEQFRSGRTVPFETAFTMTNANIASGATGEQGKDITIGTQTVSGQGGINGYIQVGDDPVEPETPAAPVAP
jgi:hypothetical protein